MEGSNEKKDTVAVVGLGYVGIPLAMMLADAGYRVFGVDIRKEQVSALNRGENPIKGKEPGLDDLIKKVVSEGSFSAHLDPSVIGEAEAVFVVVQTPFDMDAHAPSYGPFRSAVATVGRNMKKGALVVVESTLVPTTTHKVVIPILEKESGMKAGVDFKVGHCPERVTPGKLLSHLSSCPRILGGDDQETRDRMRSYYEKIVKGPIDEGSILTAEVVKTTENAYRDVNIAFANEIALICEVLGVDVYEVRNLVNKVPSRSMHFPGAGVGGHCIPKDSLLLSYSVRGRFHPRLMMTARDINDHMPAHTATLVKDALAEADVRPSEAVVCVLGASYLKDSDDIRKSPALGVVNTLVFEDISVRLHDPYVTEDLGYPLLRDLETALSGADAAVLVTDHSVYYELTPEKLSSLMRRKIIVDGRNVFSRREFQRAGFIFRGVGK